MGLSVLQLGILPFELVFGGFDVFLPGVLDAQVRETDKDPEQRVSFLEGLLDSVYGPLHPPAYFLLPCGLQHASLPTATFPPSSTYCLASWRHRPPPPRPARSFLQLRSTTASAGMLFQLAHPHPHHLPPQTTRDHLSTAQWHVRARML